MPENGPETQPPEETAGERLEWRCWPLADEWPRSAAKTAVVVGMCVLAAIAFEGVWYGVLAAVVLTGALARYFLPTWYVLDDSGLTVRQGGAGRRMAWSQVRRAVVGRAGVFLSPLASPSRLDSFRGVFLPFAGNAREVTEFVRRKTNLVA